MKERRKFLLIRASRGREVLAEQLTAAGAEVEQIVVYTSADVMQADPNVSALLRAGRIDWITVTSSAIARSLAAMFGGELRCQAGEHQSVDLERASRVGLRAGGGSGRVHVSRTYGGHRRKGQ